MNVNFFLKNRRESVSNEQCKVQSDCKSQAIYKQQSAESLLIPNQQSANLLKLEHTGTWRFSIPVCMQYPFYNPKIVECITGCPSSSHFHFWVIYSEEPNHQNLEHVSPLKEPFGFFVKLNSGLHIELKQTILQVLLLTFEFSKLTLELSDFFFREDAS